jgi:hypothetical protein
MQSGLIIPACEILDIKTTNYEKDIHYSSPVN